MSKKPISAKTLERQLKVHYETAWYLLHKIRIALGNRNAEYSLSGLLEVDEMQLSVMDLSEEENIKGTGKRRGRGANQAKVLVMTSFKEYKDKKGRNKRGLNKVAMELIEDYTSETIGNIMTNWVKRHARIYTDGFSSYQKLKEKFPNITQTIASGLKAVEELPIVHRVIGNFKNQLVGIHHSVSQLHLQNYLDEFCYKQNRSHIFSDLVESIAFQSVRFSWHNSR